MKTISIDAPNVCMESCQADFATSPDLQLDFPEGIDQRDIEDLQILAKWFESTSIEFEDLDEVFCDFDQLKSALS